MVAVLASARRMGAISSAPISRRFVAHMIAAGAFHSSMVSAYEAWVLRTTSNPCCRKASVRRFEKYTLLSISKILGRFASALIGRASRSRDDCFHGIPLPPANQGPGSRYFLRRSSTCPKHILGWLLAPHRQLRVRNRRSLE